MGGICMKVDCSSVFSLLSLIDCGLRCDSIVDWSAMEKTVFAVDLGPRKMR